MLGGEIGHEAPDQAAHPCEVLRKDRQNLLVGDRLDAGTVEGAGVVVGHEGDAGETHPQLTGQGRLGDLRHVHHVAAECREPARLGPGGKAGALDDHHRAGLVNGDPSARAAAAAVCRSAGQYGSAKVRWWT